MGIRDHPIAPRSPWQNGHAERLIGSIRRECLDHIVVFGEGHLGRILTAYTGYYNELRTHLSLDKDSPWRRVINGLVKSPVAQSWADFTINTAGHSFRQGRPRRTAGFRNGHAYRVHQVLRRFAQVMSLRRAPARDY
jgi:hypothetical protein